MKDKFRMFQWVIFAGMIYAAAMFVTQPQIQIVLWKVGHITVGAFVGYWVDRRAFKDSRLYAGSPPTVQVRRAIIISAAILAVSMGM